MSERPILFNAPMVRAILGGSKTQTRRVAIPKRSIEPMTDECPYGQPGDRLWVREPWRAWPDGAAYLADFYDTDFADAIHAPWRPSTRAASRITLEIAAVRIERLQAISEADAMAEGVDPAPPIEFHERHQLVTPAARRSFARLWDSLNGPGSWDANPWVWVIEFRRVEGQR